MNTAPPLFAETEFRKAARSEPDKNCVLVARRGGWVELRDSKTTFGTTDDHRLVFTAEEFDAYLAGARANRIDDLCLEITAREDGTHLFRRRGWAGVQLAFTEAETAAFQDGIANREFEANTYTA